MNRKKTIRLCSVACAVCLLAASLSGCTSIADHMDNLLDAMGDVLGTDQPTTQTGPVVEDEREPLASPSHFTIDEHGNYSFAAVPGASYYVLQFCEAGSVSDADDYLFVSPQIEDDGSAVYTGNCQDLFHYAYRNYTAKVFAYPELTDSEKKVSAAATCEYSFSGEIDAPELSYFWNTNTKTIEFYVNNIETSYYYQAYPDTIEIDLISKTGETDDQTLVIDPVSETNYYISYEGLAEDTYDIVAFATSTNDAVLNQHTETVTVAADIELGATNKLSDNYYHSGDNYDVSVKPLYSSAWGWWPLLCESFDLTNGGNAGTVIGRKGDFVTFVNATPVQASEGSVYTFETEIGFNPPAVVSYGTLELYADHTFRLTVGRTGPMSDGYLTGSWVDNGDGTATLSYNPNDNIKA